MSERDNISDKELKDIAPLLFGMEKEELKAPIGYFDSLADRVLAQVEKEEGAVVVEISRPMPSKIFTWAIAAGIAAIAGIFIVSSDATSVSEFNLLADLEISVEEDIDYLLEIDEEMIMDTYLAEGTIETESEDINYLMDEDFDYEDYINVDL
jgi:hypothetical protein